MTLLKNTFCIFAVFLFLNSANASGTKSPFNAQIQNEYLAKYFNSFETIGELIEGMQFSGFFGPEDRQEILLKLKEMGVDANAKLHSVKAEGNRIRFGKTAVLVNDANGKIKTGDGHVINISKHATVTDIIMQTVHLQTGKKVASLSGLLFNPAWADVVDKIDALESGFAAFAKQFGSVFIGDIVYPVTGLAAGGAGGVVDFFTWAIRTWLKTGTVKCQGSSYAALGFEDGRSLTEIWNGKKPKAYEDINKLCSDENRSKDVTSAVITGHFRVLCKVTDTGMTFFDESFDKRKESFYPIKETALKRELGEPIPTCTPELASILTDKLKARLRAGIDAAKQGKPSRLVYPAENHSGAQ